MEIRKFFGLAWAGIGHAGTVQFVGQILIPAGVVSAVGTFLASLTEQPLWFLFLLAVGLFTMAAIALYALLEIRRIRGRRGSPAVAASVAPALPDAPVEIPIWKAVEHVRAVLGDNNEDECYLVTRQQIRQAAERGRITLFGRKELRPPKTGYASEIWTEIEKSYWQDHGLNSLATGVMFADHDHTAPEPPVVDGYRQRYWAVMARKNEIEAAWPRSANVGFDTTFHHLIRHVAINSVWAGAFVPNDAPDYLIRMLNDPWDALKREVCGPLAEGKLSARGILWPRNAPKENAFSDIPRDFWKTAQFDIRNTLLSRRANGASGPPGTYVGIIVRSDEVDAAWPDRTPEEIVEKPSPFVALAKGLSADEVEHQATWAELAAREDKSDAKP